MAKNEILVRSSSSGGARIDRIEQLVRSLPGVISARAEPTADGDLDSVHVAISSHVPRYRIRRAIHSALLIYLDLAIDEDQIAVTVREHGEAEEDAPDPVDERGSVDDRDQVDEAPKPAASARRELPSSTARLHEEPDEDRELARSSEPRIHALDAHRASRSGNEPSLREEADESPAATSSTPPASRPTGPRPEGLEQPSAPEPPEPQGSPSSAEPERASRRSRPSSESRPSRESQSTQESRPKVPRPSNDPQPASRSDSESARRSQTPSPRQTHDRSQRHDRSQTHDRSRTPERSQRSRAPDPEPSPAPAADASATVHLRFLGYRVEGGHGSGVQVRVGVEAGGRRFQGTVPADGLEALVLDKFAEAAVIASDKAIQQTLASRDDGVARPGLRIVGIEKMQAHAHPILSVSVSRSSEGGVESAIGFAMIGSDIHRAAALATLDAVRRLVGESVSSFVAEDHSQDRAAQDPDPFLRWSGDDR